MADKTPIRTVYTDGVATGLAEYQSGETVGLTHGGLGASLSIGSAGQVLKVNSGASALEFGAVEAIINIDTATNLTSNTLATGDQIMASDGGTEGRVTLGQLDTLFSGTTKTLTNKTINASNNTVSNIVNSMLSGSAGITNANLANSAVTVGSTSISLGASATTIAGVSNLTAGTINITGNVISSTDSTVVEIGSGDGLSVAGNLTVAGNMTVSGTTTSLATTNTAVTDNLLELNSGVGSNSDDSGIIIERGSTGNNAIMFWDESEDKFAFGTTTATATSNGNLTVADGDLRVGDISATTYSGAGIKDEDNMVSDSATHLASQQSIKKYVDDKVTAEDLDVTSDSGTIDIDLDSETMTIAGGTGIDTSATGTTVTIAGEDASTSNKGIASFATADFSVSSGAVSIKSGGITNTQLANSSITFTDESSTAGSVALGGNIEFLAGEGIDTAVSGRKITITGEDASTSNKGIASFTAADFSVSSGAVSLVAERVQDIIGAMVGSNTETRITVTYQDADGTIDFVVDNDLANYDNSSSGFITASSSTTLTNKTYNADGTGNSLTNVEDANIKAAAAIDATKIADGSVTSAEFQYINTLSSNAQTQLDVKASKAFAIAQAVALG
jgi:hypothetical protein